MHYLIASLLLMLAPAWALAASEKPEGARIALSATVEMELPNDEVVISFRVEKQGKDVRAIRQEVNRMAGAIEKRLRREPGLKLETTSRHLQPLWHYPKNAERVRTGWQMVQAGRVISSRLDEVAGWLEDIEAAGAHLSGLQFRISSSAMENARAELSQQALRKFRDKAAAMARGLGADNFRIVSLSADSRMPAPIVQRREMAMMAAAREAEPPALSAGEGTVRLTVSGEIELPYMEYPAQ